MGKLRRVPASHDLSWVMGYRGISVGVQCAIEAWQQAAIIRSRFILLLADVDLLAGVMALQAVPV